MKELIEIAGEEATLKERNRIAKLFYDYPKRESLPLDIQKDIIKMIMVDIQF